MRNERLRVFTGKDDPLNHDQPPQVTVRLAEIFPLLADALATDRTWLHDFGDEKIAISTDLYELITAYQRFHRPSA